MKARTALSTLTLAAAAALLAIPAYSQPGNGNGNGNGKGPPQGKGPAAAQSANQNRGNAGNNGKSYNSNPGQGNRPSSGSGHGNGYADGRSGATLSLQFSFNDQQRNYLRDYYGNQFRMGNCPPGLAKKNNGCMPPGHAKKWRIGYPLSSDVIFYDLPGAVLAQLGPAPRGYRYARVADDILMLAVGTGLVVDAVASLSQ